MVIFVFILLLIVFLKHKQRGDLMTSSLNLSHSLANITAEKDKDKKSKDKKNKRRSLLDTTSKLLKGLELTASMGASTLGDSKKEVEVSGPLHLVRLEEEKQKKRPNVPSTPRQVLHAGWLCSIKPKKRKRSKHNFPNKQRVPKKYWCRLEVSYLSLLSFVFLSLFLFLFSRFLFFLSLFSLSLFSFSTFLCLSFFSFSLVRLFSSFTFSLFPLFFLLFPCFSFLLFYFSPLFLSLFPLFIFSFSPFLLSLTHSFNYQGYLFCILCNGGE